MTSSMAATATTTPRKPKALPPGAGLGGYIADVYHEIETPAGTVRVEPGYRVEIAGDGTVTASPPQAG